LPLVTRKTIDELLAEARSRLDRLEPEEAFAAQREGALIVDTRSHDERRRTGIIPGSLHVPLSVLPWRLDPAADPAYRSPFVEGIDQQLVLVCAHGYSTSLAAAMLQQLGFWNATDLAGGFTAWQERGLPIRPAPEVDEHAPPGLGPPDPMIEPPAA
jgi:rhodanese-related sulfurtransferase